ncbi:Heterokaryon incompatibility protein 6, OR allele [Fusarium oxysporum f. sp. albedinis]|nr:Heterokaryon incompatibility protein 6, OR allele [Fusarium oxysporum f. sp. albedinis]
MDHHPMFGLMEIRSRRNMHELMNMLRTLRRRPQKPRSGLSQERSDYSEGKFSDCLMICPSAMRTSLPLSCLIVHSTICGNFFFSSHSLPLHNHIRHPETSSFWALAYRVFGR